MGGGTRRNIWGLLVCVCASGVAAQNAKAKADSHAHFSPAPILSVAFRSPLRLIFHQALTAGGLHLMLIELRWMMAVWQVATQTHKPWRACECFPCFWMLQTLQSNTRKRGCLRKLSSSMDTPRQMQMVRKRNSKTHFKINKLILWFQVVEIIYIWRHLKQFHQTSSVFLSFSSSLLQTVRFCLNYRVNISKRTYFTQTFFVVSGLKRTVGGSRVFFLRNVTHWCSL